MRDFTCPYLSNCEIYNNWVQQSKDNRLNVIEGNASGYYHCLAFIAIQDPISEGGVQINPDLEKRFSRKPEDIECSHIQILNLLGQIERRV